MAQQLCRAAADLARRGWTPATSSNFSARLDAGCIAITVSGRDKGRLTPADIMLMDDQARALDAQCPSAEARLHAQIYRMLPQTGAVLHTHSQTQTVASLHFAAAGVVRLH
ncbi:methylthioribulose-1-phosphate dehydratase, partial [mine drainage metagenome]